MKNFRHLLLCVAFIIPNLAEAGLISTRTVLDSLLGTNQTLEDFENFTTTSQTNSSATLNDSANWAGLGTGLVAPGVDYTGSGGRMFLNVNGYYGLSTYTLGDSISGRNLNLIYTTPITAFGFDLQSYVGFGTSGTVSVYDTSGGLLGSGAVNGGINGASSFFGWEDAAGVGNVVIAAAAGAYLMIDNHGYGAATGAPVPAPATLALFGLGLAGLGWSRRKKA